MSILVTGANGFLGLHVVEALLARGETVIGVDTLDAGYDPALQAARRLQLDGRPGFTLLLGDLTSVAIDGVEIAALVHLASPSMRVCAHLDLLGWCRDRLPALRHAVYPSATPDDLLARAYARLHGLPQTGLRLGDIYGPWGRPDALPCVLADAIVAGRPVTLRAGQSVRLLHVDDAVAGILAALDRPPPNGHAPHRVFDLAGSAPVELEWLLTVLEDVLVRPAERRFAGWPSGGHDDSAPDLAATDAALGWRPAIGIEDGLARFAAWHRDHYGA